MAKKNGRRALWFVFLSLLIHSTALYLVSRQWEWRAVPSESLTTVDVVPISTQDLEKLRGQVVNTAEVRPAQTPVPTLYLGKHTQRVQRQTRASIVAPFKEPSHRLTLAGLGVKMNFQPLGNNGPGQPASTSDELKDVANGAQTLLNTREYAYFSYYQRVRESLEKYWEPGLRERIRKMSERGRQLASDQENSTRLIVVLDREGAITRILVNTSSGMLDVDEAAIEAFNKAGPFPNPPRGLVENDGTVRVEWNFILKT